MGPEYKRVIELVANVLQRLKDSTKNDLGLQLPEGFICDLDWREIYEAPASKNTCSFSPDKSAPDKKRKRKYFTLSAAEKKSGLPVRLHVHRLELDAEGKLPATHEANERFLAIELEELFKHARSAAQCGVVRHAHMEGAHVEGSQRASMQQYYAAYFKVFEERLDKRLVGGGGDGGGSTTGTSSGAVVVKDGLFEMDVRELRHVIEVCFVLEELVDAKELVQLVKSPPKPCAAMKLLFAQVCGALAAYHNNNFSYGAPLEKSVFVRFGCGGGGGGGGGGCGGGGGAPPPSVILAVSRYAATPLDPKAFDKDVDGLQKFAEEKLGIHWQQLLNDFNLKPGDSTSHFCEHLAAAAVSGAPFSSDDDPWREHRVHLDSVDEEQLHWAVCRVRRCHQQLAFFREIEEELARAHGAADPQHDPRHHHEPLWPLAFAERLASGKPPLDATELQGLLLKAGLHSARLDGMASELLALFDGLGDGDCAVDRKELLLGVAHLLPESRKSELFGAYFAAYAKFEFEDGRIVKGSGHVTAEDFRDLVCQRILPRELNHQPAAAPHFEDRFEALFEHVALSVPAGGPLLRVNLEECVQRDAVLDALLLQRDFHLARERLAEEERARLDCVKRAAQAGAHAHAPRLVARLHDLIFNPVFTPTDYAQFLGATSDTHVKEAGSGCYGTVWKIGPYAVKRLKKGSWPMAMEARNEALALRLVSEFADCANLPRLVQLPQAQSPNGSWGLFSPKGSGEFFIITEWLDHSFPNWLDEPQRVADIATVLQDVLTAALKLNALGIVHRDIKLNNVMVRKRAREGAESAVEGVLIDLGCARLPPPAWVASSPTSVPPPEEFEGGPESSVYDEWGCGALVAYALGVVVSGNVTPSDVASVPSVLIQAAAAATPHGVAALSERVAEEAQALIRGLREADPAQRLRLLDAVRHPFFELAKGEAASLPGRKSEYPSTSTRGQDAPQVYETPSLPDPWLSLASFKGDDTKVAVSERVHKLGVTGSIDRKMLAEFLHFSDDDRRTHDLFDFCEGRYRGVADFGAGSGGGGGCAGGGAGLPLGPRAVQVGLFHALLAPTLVPDYVYRLLCRNGAAELPRCSACKGGLDLVASDSYSVFLQEHEETASALEQLAFAAFSRDGKLTRQGAAAMLRDLGWRCAWGAGCAKPKHDAGGDPAEPGSSAPPCADCKPPTEFTVAGGVDWRSAHRKFHSSARTLSAHTSLFEEVVRTLDGASFGVFQRHCREGRGARDGLPSVLRALVHFKEPGFARALADLGSPPCLYAGDGSSQEKSRAAVMEIRDLMAWEVAGFPFTPVASHPYLSCLKHAALAQLERQ